MTLLSQAPAQHVLRIFVRGFAFLFGSALALLAQNPGTQSTTQVAPSTAVSAPAPLRGVIQLDGPWKFQNGDDPRWADPGFDDSNWQAVSLSERLDYQGIEPYSGYAWYRLRLQPQQLAAFGNPSQNLPLELLVFPDSVGQISVFVNGVELAGPGG